LQKVSRKELRNLGDDLKRGGCCCKNSCHAVMSKKLGGEFLPWKYENHHFFLSMSLTSDLQCLHLLATTLKTNKKRMKVSFNSSNLADCLPHPYYLSLS
jgi:hypothetical protein